MDTNKVIVLIYKVVAQTIGITSIVLGFFHKEASNETYITMLGIGMTTIALEVLF